MYSSPPFSSAFSFSFFPLPLGYWDGNVWRSGFLEILSYSCSLAFLGEMAALFGMPRDRLLLMLVT